jgi:hypothetical protein
MNSLDEAILEAKGYKFEDLVKMNFAELDKIIETLQEEVHNIYRMKMIKISNILALQDRARKELVSQCESQ